MRFKRDRSISLNWSWRTDDVSSHINFGKQAVLIVAITFARRKATAQKSEWFSSIMQVHAIDLNVAISF